jgi:uncharacterized OB-fold protein
VSDAEIYRRGLEASQLLLRKCARCGQSAFPPMPGCPHCGHAEGEVVQAAGHGTLYSWTVCHHAFDAQFAGETPYVVGVVALAEGARVVARIDIEAHALQPDMPLRATFPAGSDGRTRLTFVTIEDRADP